jgi:IS1 family transposase
MYLWRAVDAEGEVLDVLLQAKRDTRAARKLMRKLLKKQGMVPDAWVTDKNPAYGAALREPKLARAPDTRRMRANNRAESSHIPVRRRERKLQGFKSPGQPSGSCPCTRPPTTPSPCLVISLPLELTASFEMRRLRHGAMRPVSAPDMASCAASRGQIRQVDKARAIASKRPRSSGVTVISIPALIPKAWTTAPNAGMLQTRQTTRLEHGSRYRGVIC